MTQGGAPGGALSNDAERLQMQEMVQDFLNHQESQKKIRGIIGKSNRLTINMDELRSFNPRLANFVLRDPLGAIKAFQDQLNQTIKGMADDATNGKGGNSEKMALATDIQFPKKT